ncbi:MAG: hypothetical protein K8R69_10750, partial [Deltaproteobacteria bacterium]|nr:hypothetical protein [Deltaproteobacteria bacterium]
GDDILLVHADRQVVETGRAEIMAVLDERGLAVSADKTYLRSTEQDFHYLGYRFDLGRVRVGEKSLDRYRRWARTVLRKELYRNRPNGTPAQRKDLLRKILRDFHEEHFHADQALAWIKCFPFVDDDQDLKVLDSFIKERIRICVTRKASAKNFQSVPESWFRECGFRSLIGAYYRVQKRRPLGPYQDWEPYLRVEAGKKKAGPSSNLGKKIRRMKSWWGWLRRAVSDDSVDGNIPNG